MILRATEAATSLSIATSVLFGNNKNISATIWC